MKKNSISSLLGKLNIEPDDMSLFIQALTHSSYAHERGLGSGAHNERLEFLGDAVLELVISEMLFRRFPFLPEGKLTRFRAELVREDTLCQLAIKLDIGLYLRLGRGEVASGGRERASLLADAFEALLGAIYLDLGYDAVEAAAEELFAEMLVSLEEGSLLKDYKTLMQEYAQARLATTPEYRIVSEQGPDHSKTFIAQFILNDRVYGEGSGRSKKDAEQEAAGNAYEKMLANFGHDKLL